MSRPQVSFEFFPPKDIEGSFRLWQGVETLTPVAPDFISITYGAGHKSRRLTHEAVMALTRTTGLQTAAHVTCAGASRHEVLAMAQDYADAGVRDIVALRGDPVDGADRFAPHPEGFADTVDLVAALAAMGRFRIHVAAHPERHPDALHDRADIEQLKRKVDAGAEVAITQVFFKAETFLRFRDDCAAAGISVPIIPGILPVTDWPGARRFAAACGVSVPPLIARAFIRATHDGTVPLLATAVATQLCDNLLAEGVEHLHFYTLNRPELVRDVCHALGLVPEPRLCQVA